jgi:hypothetical protein
MRPPKEKPARVGKWPWTVQGQGPGGKREKPGEALPFFAQALAWPGADVEGPAAPGPDPGNVMFFKIIVYEMSFL